MMQSLQQQLLSGQQFSFGPSRCSRLEERSDQLIPQLIRRHLWTTAWRRHFGAWTGTISMTHSGQVFGQFDRPWIKKCLQIIDVCKIHCWPAILEIFVHKTKKNIVLNAILLCRRFRRSISYNFYYNQIKTFEIMVQTLNLGIC